MANRPGSPGHNSSASSTIELPNVRGLNKQSTHPEEWTLPHEWNIEKREMFGNWKMDVQNQIANIAGTLTNSLQKHPRSDIGGIDYTDKLEDSELQSKLQERERQAGRTLNYGLARIPVPDKY